MKSLKTLKFGNVCFVRPDLQFESSYSYCSKHILIQIKKKYHCNIQFAFIIFVLENMRKCFNQLMLNNIPPSYH